MQDRPVLPQATFHAQIANVGLLQAQAVEPRSVAILSHFIFVF
jgi:hypothetical protein